MRKKKKTLSSNGDPTAVESLAPELRLVDKKAVARAASVSCRTIENYQTRRLIPFVKLSARCIRFHLPSVIAALRRFELKERTR
jgi:hypothetical protein